jgi:S1-C subfamily serine protease
MNDIVRNGANGIAGSTRAHEAITTITTIPTSTPPAATPTTAVSSKEMHANISENIYDTIVRIVVHEAVFDFELPFKIRGNRTASGTGFFIDKQGHILTCSHVVQNASHVYIEIPTEGKRQYTARVLGICPFFDLAVVKIEGYANRQHCDLDTFTDGNIKSGDETYALGFPLGQDNLKVTKGIISGQQHNMYQVDTPINPGNSGGPLIKNNLVIGVNGAGIMSANNVGYAVPISRYFLIQDLLYMNHRLIHYPEIFGFEFQRTNQDFIDFLEYSCSSPTDVSDSGSKDSRDSKDSKDSPQRNKSVKKSLTMKSLKKKKNSGRSSSAATRSRGGSGQTCAGGVYVKRTYKKSPIDGLRLKEGDIVCAINGVALDHYGEFSNRWMNQKMSMSNMLCSLPLNEKVSVSFWCHAQKKTFTKSFVLKEYKMPIRRVYPEFEKEAVAYEVVGGMVVMQLSQNHLTLSPWVRDSKYQKIENRHEPKVILTTILMGSSLAISKTISGGDIIAEVNDRKVKSLAEFREALAKTLTRHGRQYIKIKTEKKNIAILSVETIQKEEPHLQGIYKYTPSALLNRLKSTTQS